MTVQVVSVTPSHSAFDQVADLFDKYRVHYGQPSSPQATHEWLNRQLTQHGINIFAAIQAEETCGFVTTTAMPASLRLGTAWSIRDLYVAPHRRRSGIARTLIEHVLKSARAARALRVSLQTESDNLSALRLYRAAGFEPVAGLELLNRTVEAEDQDPQDAP